MPRGEKAAAETDLLPPSAANGQGLAGRDLRAEARAVLQVEKHDYTDLRPIGRAPVQGMAGFDPIYTDIVDYIIRCTHRIWDERDVGLIYSHYAHNAIALLAMIPDATWTPHHVCTVEDANEGGSKTALRWTLEGHHTGWGALGAPTGKPLLVMGMSQFHLKDGRIAEEYTLWDELALRVQLKLPPA